MVSVGGIDDGTTLNPGIKPPVADRHAPAALETSLLVEELTEAERLASASEDTSTPTFAARFETRSDSDRVFL